MQIDKILRRRFIQRLLRHAVEFVLFAAALTAGLAQNSTPSPQAFPLSDTSALSVAGGKAEAVEYMGRKAVRLTTAADNDMFAFVKGTDMQDGAIDVDIAVRTTTPPGVRMPGFTGVAFRARPDHSHYEMFYLRPKNSLAEDQAMRNHSVQYVANPGFDWRTLRHDWPWLYEAWADLKPEKWTHVRIEVHGRSARLFVNGSDQPSLIVNGLKGEDLKGSIALWGYPNEESYFSNLRITPETPAPLCNCGNAAGAWHVALATDDGRFEGAMDLQVQGSAISGTWSGALGEKCPVTGTWRNGYIDLKFTGQWPNDNPGPVTARLAGWIDGDAGSGRVSIAGRADGQWTAERKR